MFITNLNQSRIKRTKTNPKSTFPPIPPSFLGSMPSPSPVQRDGELELKSVYNTLFLLLLSPQGEGSFPCSDVCPYHRRQSSTNFSSMSTSHKLLFFMNCLSMGPSSFFSRSFLVLFCSQINFSSSCVVKQLKKPPSQSIYSVRNDLSWM